MPPKTARSQPRPSAFRPLRKPGQGKRALTHVGGPVESVGDPALAAPLAAAFGVRAGERDATLTHPFHAYPARLHPEVARSLIAWIGRRFGAEAIVLDPCCGSGTVLVEAMAAGHPAVGTDLSTLAIELAAIKTQLSTNAQRRALVESAHALAREAAARVRSRARAPVPPGEERWFAPHTLAEIAALAALIAAERDPFLLHAERMLLSSVLVKVSRQLSDSDPRLVDKPVAPGAALHFFARKSLELSRCLAALARATPPNTPAPIVAVDDATQLATVPDASVDAVVTSPPYANTYDYVAHHARRYAWLKLDSRPLAAGEIGAARWFAVPERGAERFDRELTAMCAAMARVLRPRGLAFLVLADGAAGATALPADEALATAAARVGLRVRARVSQDRPTFDRISAEAFSRRPKREHLIALGHG